MADMFDKAYVEKLKSEEKYKELFEYCTELTLSDDAEAFAELADCYFYGRYVNVDYQKSLYYFHKAAYGGSMRGYRQLGYMYQKGVGCRKNMQKAFEWYIKAAKQGDVDAQFNLALCYENGDGVEQNYFNAVEWYTKAAEQGDAAAQCNLAFCYKKGYGVEQNKTKAVEWYTKASEQGFPICCNLLEEVAENGDSNAQYSLATSYYLEQDYAKAVKWWTKAAEQGYAKALCILGVCYWEGIGVTQNKVKAIEYLNNAKEQGDSDAVDVLKELEIANSDLSKSPEDYIKMLLHKIQVLEEKMDDLSTQLSEHDVKVSKKLDNLLQLTKKIEAERAQLEKMLLNKSKKNKLSDSKTAELVRELSKYIHENVTANKPTLTAVEAELKNIFGDTWNKLHSFTKTSLKSARLLWQQCMDMPASADFDYSGICICATAALENELKIHFFDNFQKYLLDTVGEPSEKWPETLLYIGHNKENDKLIYRAKYDKYFSIGTIKYLFNEADDKIVCDEYFKTILKKKHSGKTATEHFTSPLFGSKSFVQRCEELRYYRNRAAHSGEVNYLDAKRCYYEIADKIDAREHAENINNILICLFEIIK